MKINVKDIDFKSYNAKSLGYKKKEKEVSILTEDSSIDAENMQLLEKCMSYWNALSDFRYRRKRNRLYYRGDQWHELMIHPDTGETVTEENYITSQGKIPFKQNMIRQLGKNIIGQFRSNVGKPMVVARNREDASISEMMTDALQAAQNLNQVKELDSRNLEEFILSGAPVSKTTIAYYPDKDRNDIFTENINVNRLFYNSDIEDIRLTDLRIIGEIIDADIEDVVATFAKSKAEAEALRNHYQQTEQYNVINQKGLSANKIDSLSFLNPSDTSKCRVFEIWEKKGSWKVLAHDYVDGSYAITDLTLKEIEELNKERIIQGVEVGLPPEEVPLIEAKDHYEETWRVKYLTPYGKLLFESDTPYLHQEHPYSLILWPLLDGEVWGVVEDIIDQQRSINRLISLIDFIMGASAKGVLFVHEDTIPDDMNIDDFASEWSKFNGVIKYKAKPGVERPYQVSTNSTNIGAHELLAMQISMIEKIIGVSGAVQGHTAKSGTPSSLYAQEAQNSTINSLDLFESFNTYRQKRDLKILKCIIQFYTEKRTLPSKNGFSQTSMYDPEMVKDVEFDYVLTQGVDTPVYRTMMEDTLLKLLEGQMIDVMTYLENTSMPYADKLLSSIKQKQQAAQQQGNGQQIPPELMQEMSNVKQQAQGQSDPRAVGMMEKLMQGLGNS